LKNQDASTFIFPGNLIIYHALLPPAQSCPARIAVEWGKEMRLSRELEATEALQKPLGLLGANIGK